MEIYHYKKDTYEYKGSTVANIDQLETKRQKRNIFLIPANATTLKPPLSEINKTLVFNEENKKWAHVDDYRGVTYFLPNDANTYTITSIGERLPKGALMEVDPIIEEKQKIANIKNKRDTARSYITVLYDSKNWSFSRENMIDFGMKIARGRDFIWVADDRSQVNLTISKAEDIAKKVDDLLTKIFFDAETEIGNL